ELRGSVETHRLAVDEGGGKRGGLVALEPGGYIGQQCEGGGVTFRKPIIAEAEYLFVNLFSEFAAVTLGGHTGEQALAIGRKPAASLPGGHRAAQAVGLAGGEAGGDHGDLHDLFLEDRH